MVAPRVVLNLPSPPGRPFGCTVAQMSYCFNFVRRRNYCDGIVHETANRNPGFGCVNGGSSRALLRCFLALAVEIASCAVIAAVVGDLLALAVSGKSKCVDELKLLFLTSSSHCQSMGKFLAGRRKRRAVSRVGRCNCSANDGAWISYLG